MIQMSRYSSRLTNTHNLPSKSTHHLSCFSSIVHQLPNKNPNTPKPVTTSPQSPFSYSSILQGLKLIKPLQQVHAHIITSGLSNNIFLSNRLMTSYIFCGFLNVAEHIFCKTPHRNIVSWTILVSGYAKYDLYMEAFDVFWDMIMSGFLPNVVTIASILPALAKLGLVQIGKSVHCFSIRRGLDVSGNVFLGTSLVDMYAKSGLMNVARRVFDSMLEKSVVSWNAIISGYSSNGFGEEAIQMFKIVQRNGFRGDFITIMSLLEACSTIGQLHLARVACTYSVKSGFENNDLLVKTAMVDMYIRCGSLEDAYRIFKEEIPVKDVVACTLMLCGFSDIGYGKKAMELLNEMTTMNLKLDSISLMAMFSSCSRTGSMQQGKRVHALAIKIGFGDDTIVGSSMIDMYANCGGLESAKRLFEGMEGKDVVCWNAMISAYGINGSGDDAIDLFSKMEDLRIEPDASTFVCVLCACSHTGMVEKGIYMFDRMVNDWRIAPNLQHYACMVHLLGRAGQMDDAYRLINSMPMQPDAGVYGALLGACRVHRNMELGLEVSKKLLELQPNDVGFYVLLSNIYATAGNWEGVKTTRVSLRSKGLKKNPGLCSIELGREHHTFVAGYRNHPEYPKIKETLTNLMERIEAAGYVPDTDSVFQDVSEEAKRDILFHHSEKLTIAFALMKTQPGESIRIVKNLRMCNDCHSASKFISKAIGRELIIKDVNRFHLFKDGVCSCRDYW